MQAIFLLISPATLPHLALGLLALLPHAGAAWLWAHKLVPAEVAKNDADITANGSQDSLRKTYHFRRNLIRGTWLLGLCAGAGLAPPFLPGVGWVAAALSCAALGGLLWAYFARYFTPWLNLKRGLPEFRASSDSASWPDARAFKLARARYVDDPHSLLIQPYADLLLRRIIARAWAWGRALYLVGLLGYVGVVIFLR